MGGNYEINFLKITKWGHFKAVDFFGHKMALAIARTIYGAKKVLGPLKSLDFVLGPFRIIEMAPFSDFQGLIS